MFKSQFLVKPYYSFLAKQLHRYIPLLPDFDKFLYQGLRHPLVPVVWVSHNVLNEPFLSWNPQFGSKEGGLGGDLLVLNVDNYQIDIVDEWGVLHFVELATELFVSKLGS